MAQVNTDDGLLTQGFFKTKFWSKLLGMLAKKLNVTDKSIIDAGSASYASDTLTIPQGKFVDATSITLGASVTLAFANAESVTLPWWWFRVETTASVTLSVPSGYGFMGETLTTLEANKTYEFKVIANKITWAVSA